MQRDNFSKTKSQQARHINVTICILPITDISVQMPSKEDIMKVEGITFPEDGDTQIFIPSELLLDEINKGQNTKLLFNVIV